MSRHLDRTKTLETISAIFLAVLLCVALLAVVSVLRFDLPGEVKLIYSGRTFPCGPWKAIYDIDGHRKIVIKPTQEEAEAWVK